MINIFKEQIRTFFSSWTRHFFCRLIFWSPICPQKRPDIATQFSHTTLVTVFPVHDKISLQLNPTARKWLETRRPKKIIWNTLLWLLYRDWPKMYLVTVGRHPKENSGEGFAITRKLCKKTLFPEKSKYSHSRVLFPFLISPGLYLPYNLKNSFWVLEKNNHSSICIWRVWKWPNRQKRTSSLIPCPVLGWQLSLLHYLLTCCENILGRRESASTYLQFFQVVVEDWHLPLQQLLTAKPVNLLAISIHYWLEKTQRTAAMNMAVYSTIKY